MTSTERIQDSHPTKKDLSEKKKTGPCIVAQFIEATKKQNKKEQHYCDASTDDEGSVSSTNAEEVYVDGRGWKEMASRLADTIASQRIEEEEKIDHHNWMDVGSRLKAVFDDFDDDDDEF